MDFVKLVLIRLFWFVAGIVAIDMIRDHEDEVLIRSGRKPVNRPMRYHKIMNPDFFMS